MICQKIENSLKLVFFKKNIQDHVKQNFLRKITFCENNFSPLTLFAKNLHQTCLKSPFLLIAIDLLFQKGFF